VHGLEPRACDMVIPLDSGSYDNAAKGEVDDEAVEVFVCCFFSLEVWRTKGGSMCALG